MKVEIHWTKKDERKSLAHRTGEFSRVPVKGELVAVSTGLEVVDRVIWLEACDPEIWLGNSAVLQDWKAEHGFKDVETKGLNLYRCGHCYAEIVVPCDGNKLPCFNCSHSLFRTSGKVGK